MSLSATPAPQQQRSQHLRSQMSASRQLDIYIAPRGNDSNAGTTAEEPLLSFGKADSLARAGATIHVAPGQYEGYTAQHSIRIASSGTEAARIRWISDVRWGAQILGHVNPTNGLGWGVLVEGSYVDLVGFDVTSNANMGIWVQGTHVRILGNHVHDIPGQRGCSSYGASGIEQGNYHGGYMEVSANVVHDVGSGGPGSCNKYHGIYLAAPFDAAQNNISYRNASKGITTWHAATRNTISNNTVFENDIGIMVGVGDLPCFESCTADHLTVTNNIIYRNRTLGFWQHTNVSGRNLYSNNLVFGNGKADVLMDGCEGRRSLGAPCSPFLKGILADPQFISPSGNVFNGNYHLRPTSPALRAGTIRGAPTIDFEGTARPRGAFPDIGAYQSTSPTSTRLRRAAGAD